LRQLSYNVSTGYNSTQSTRAAYIRTLLTIGPVRPITLPPCKQDFTVLQTIRIQPFPIKHQIGRKLGCRLEWVHLHTHTRTRTCSRAHTHAHTHTDSYTHKLTHAQTHHKPACQNWLRGEDWCSPAVGETGVFSEAKDFPVVSYTDTPVLKKAPHPFILFPFPASTFIVF